MRINKILVISLVLSAYVSFLSSCDPQDDKNNAIDGWEHIGGDKPDETDKPDVPEEPEKWFKMRGLVLGWSEVSNPSVIDYIKIARENGLNTFSVYNADRTTQNWKNFAKKCEDAGIDLEFEEHMMSFLLPREMFDTHPEYFRMDKNGKRTNDANGCPSNQDALDVVRIKAKEIARNYTPTNDRYYFWLDDGGDICHCDKCKDLNASDQALIYENVIIEAVRELNPNGMVAHLCYHNTLNPPKTIKPKEGIFFEFAPFYRSWTEPLANTWAKGSAELTHADYLRALKENLEVFPVETAQVLEYWMDDSLFSGWNQNNLVQVPWSNEIFLSDLKTYASYGIRNITCYAAYVGPSYVQKFGFPDFLVDYAQGLYNYENE